jgi:hypothetical protein
MNQFHRELLQELTYHQNSIEPISTETISIEINSFHFDLLFPIQIKQQTTGMDLAA